MSGKKKMEPSPIDAIEELEAAKRHKEKVHAMRPRPPQAEIISVDGSVLQAKDNYKAVAGAEYKERPPVRAKDRQVLVDFFEATHGHRWANAAGWRGRRGGSGRAGLEHFEVHASHWHGVECELGETGAAVCVGLSLADNEVEGALPGGLGGLADLRVLNLGSNLFEGALPEGLLAGLTDLEALTLSRNRFTGPLAPMLGLALDPHEQAPPEPEQHPLRELDLASNALTGPIPPGLLGPSLPHHHHK